MTMLLLTVMTVCFVVAHFCHFRLGSQQRLHIPKIAFDNVMDMSTPCSYSFAASAVSSSFLAKVRLPSILRICSFLLSHGSLLLGTFGCSKL